MKFCKDCEYHVNRFYYFDYLGCSPLHYCEHHTLDRDLVTGEVKPVPCEDARDDLGHCTSDAINFTPKPPLLVRLFRWVFGV